MEGFADLWDFMTKGNQQQVVLADAELQEAIEAVLAEGAEVEDIPMGEGACGATTQGYWQEVEAASAAAVPEQASVSEGPPVPEQALGSQGPHPGVA